MKLDKYFLNMAAKHEEKAPGCNKVGRHDDDAAPCSGLCSSKKRHIGRTPTRITNQSGGGAGMTGAGIRVRQNNYGPFQMRANAPGRPRRDGLPTPAGIRLRRHASEGRLPGSRLADRIATVKGAAP